MKQPLSVRKLRKRILFLESIDLSKTNKNKICNLVKNSFKIPYNEFLWKAQNDKLIYRSCIHPNADSKGAKPYCTISRIAYNPDPTDELGRAYLGNKKIVSYASSGYDTAIIESCQYSLRNSNDREFFVTVGGWRLTDGVSASIVCHNNAALKEKTDLSIAHESINQLNIKKGFSRRKIKSLNLINKFFSDQYAKKNIASMNDYLYSAFHANTNLKHNSIDAIIYPSQAYEYKGFNFSFSGDLFDKGRLTLVNVKFTRVKFGPDVRDYPDIETIKETSTFVGNTIVW